MISLLAALLGFYSQDCSRGVIRAQEFSAASSISSEFIHFDAACTQVAMLTRSYGNFRMGGERAPEQIDFTFSRVTVTPLSDGVAEDYRRRVVCGIAGWQKDRETTVTGLVCEFSGWPQRVPAAGEARYGILKAEADRIYLGQLQLDRDALTPERRPREWDPRPYVRVPKSAIK